MSYAQTLSWFLALTALALFAIVYRSRREPMRTRISAALAHGVTRTGASLATLGAVFAGWFILKAGPPAATHSGLAGLFAASLLYGATFILWDRRISMASRKGKSA